MSKKGQSLVGRNSIDGIILGVPEDRRAAALAIAQQCGYDANRARPFYPVAVPVCIARELGHLLYPDEDEATAQFNIGYLTSKGYSTTIAGMSARAQSQRMKLDDVINYSLTVTKRELSTFNFNVELPEPRQCRIEVFNFPQHPSYLAGALIYSLELNGARNPAYVIELAEEAHCIYLFSWA